MTPAPSSPPESNTAKSFRYIRGIKKYLEGIGAFENFIVDTGDSGYYSLRIIPKIGLNEEKSKISASMQVQVNWRSFFKIVSHVEERDSSKCAILLETGDQVNFDMIYLFRGFDFSLERTYYAEMKAYGETSLSNLNRDFKKFLHDVYHTVEKNSIDFYTKGYGYSFFAPAPFKIVSSNWGEWNNSEWLRQILSEYIGTDSTEIREDLLELMVNKIEVYIISWEFLHMIGCVDEPE